MKNKFSLIIIILLLTNVNSFSQCVTNVDLRTWAQKGPTANGNWEVDPAAGSFVNQTINGQPTFFVNPQDLINVEISGKLEVYAAGDDDYIGFVVGYKAPLGTGTNYDYLTFFWAGNELNGTTTHANRSCYLRKVVGTSNVDLQTNHTYPRWERNISYNFTCLYTSSRIVVKIENDTVIDLNGCFEPGKFGFYNHSQGGVRYSDYSYRSVTDFSFQNDSICVGSSPTQNAIDLDLFCYGNTVTSPYNVIRWEMGDGTILNDSTNFSYNYSTPGVQNIKLYTEDLAGCADSLVKTITVFDHKVTLPQDIDSCINGTVPITPSIVSNSPFSPISYLWNTAQTSSSITTDTSGIYTIQTTNDIGCTSYDTINITIHEVPNAEINFNNVCFPNQTDVNDASTITNGSIISWNWNFDDGNTDNTQNPTHFYNTPGLYNISLDVTSNNNCVNNQTISYEVYDLPNAQINYNSICFPNQAILSDASTINIGSITSWDWNFGDGNTSSAQNPAHSYSNSGTYEVELIVTSNNNCTNKDSITYYLNDLPIAQINFNNSCFNDNADIIDASTINIGNIVSWNWSFGDGNSSASQNPSHTYSSPGVYNIQLTVISDSNCINSQNISYEVYELPIVNAGADTVLLCDPPVIDLNGNLSATGNNYSFNWNTNDGVIESNATTLNPTISSQGDYVLTVTNNTTNCFNNDTVFVFNDTASAVSILINNGNEININTLIEHLFSYEGNKGVVSWNINDDVFSNDSIVNYTFSESGEQIATITLVNDSNGCVANDTIRLNLTHVLKIPGAVSANEDNYNDAFIIRALENYEDNSLTIFNRWGNLIFEASPYLNDWKGQSISGGEVVDGTYFYVLSLTDQGEETIHKGSIELKRL